VYSKNLTRQSRTEVNALPEAQSQEDILADSLASLTAADIPPDEDERSFPGPGVGRPAELNGLATAELDDLTAAQPEPPSWPGPAGCLPGGGPGAGAGFAQGGVLDELPAGRVLAGFAADADEHADDLDDDSLIGLLRAHDRQASHEAAAKLAIIAKLARRRPADRTPAPAAGQLPEQLSEFLADEVAVALTLTRRAAEDQVELALQLAARPAIAAALGAGRIDLYKARILVEALAPLEPLHAAAVQAAIVPAAAGLTSGQLRAELTQAILALDPDAMRKRRQAAEKDARVELWTNPDGTTTLAGRDLPPAAALAANKRICQVAAHWKKLIRAAWKHHDPAGEQPRPEHGMDLLRAWAYLALLNGQPVDLPPAGFLPPADLPSPDSPDASTSPDGDTADSATPGTGGGPGAGTGGSPDRPAGPGGPAGQDVPAGLHRPGPVPGPYRGDPAAGLPPLAGTIHLTLPLATLLGLTDRPGVAAGHGALPGDVARALANAAVTHKAASWGLIITDPHGHAVGYGQPSRFKPIRGHPADGWTLTLTTERIAGGYSP
jgi:hypothetical protein